MTIEHFPTKMNRYLTVWASLIIFLQASAQKLQYQVKYRNFTVESETDSIYAANMTIYYEEDIPKTNCTFNVTKDVHVKHIHLVLNRYSFETLHCEFYESRKIRNNLKSFVYEGAHVAWTPAINSVTPKLDFPIVKKNIYRAIGAHIDENRAVTLYPNAMNYFWRLDVTFVDHSDRNAALLKFEYELLAHVLKRKTLNSTNRTDLGSESRSWV